MNKPLVGCLAGVVVLAVGGAVGAYHFLWRPTRAYVTSFTKLQEIPRLNQQVRKQSAFTPPAGQLLSADAVERFLATQRSIVKQLGQRVDELHAKYRLLTPEGGTPRQPSFTEIVNAYRDLAGLIVDAKRAQVEALNQQQFSLAEYEWTRQRIYEAAGIPNVVDLEQALRAIAEGRKEDAESARVKPATSAADIPEANRTLVAPYQKELTDRAVFVAFGL